MIIKQKHQNVNKMKKSFADTFPEPTLVLDLCELCSNINKVKENDNKKGVSPEEAIGSKYKLQLWIDAEFSVEAMVVTEQRSSSVLVVFKHSSGGDDWRTNVNFSLSRFQGAPNNVLVHKGFHNALQGQGITTQIEEKVIDLVGNDGEVIITGHSQG